MARVRRIPGVPMGPGGDTFGVPPIAPPQPGITDPSNPPPVVPPGETENHPNGPEPGPGLPPPPPSFPKPPKTPRPIPPPPIVPPPAAPPAPPVPPPSSYAVEANMEKFNNQEHQSPMYQMLRALSKYDPRKGLKQDGLEASLDALGIGDFTINDDDELSVSGYDGWEGVTDWDVIKGFDTGEGVWVGQGLNGSAAGVGQAPPAQAAPPPSPGGVTAPPAQPGIDPQTLEQLMASFGQMFGDLGEDYGGPQDNQVYEDPTVEVGQDPFSQLITGGLAGLIQTGGQGFSDTGMASNDALLELLQNGGDFDDSIVNARMESARENAERWRMGQMDTLKSGLANRGLLGSGPERTGMERIGLEMEGIGATALRDIFADESGASNERLMSAIQMGMDGGQANNRTLLDTLQAGTERQLGLSQVALQSLSQNMEWNKFLAEFGLDRAQVMEEMQAGRIDAILPLIQMFIQMAGQARGGYV